MFISTETFAHDGVRDIQTDDFHNISLNSHFFLSFFLFSSFLFFSAVVFPLLTPKNFAIQAFENQTWIMKRI